MSATYRSYRSPRAPVPASSTPLHTVPVRPLAAALILAIAAGPAVAATLPVTSCEDDGSSGTLRSVVAGAASGDTIDLTGLSCAVITLNGSEIAVTAASLTLLGPGQSALSIDGNDASRIFAHSGNGILTINGLTLTRGRAEAASTNSIQGGCIASPAGGVAVVDSTVTACNAINTVGSAAGGGIQARTGLTVTRSTLSHNAARAMPSGTTATVANGGAAVSNGLTTLTDSFIIGNSATAGGSTAVHISQGGGLSSSGLNATGSVLADNFTGCDTSTLSCNNANGGAVNVSLYGAQMNIDRCIIVGNRAESNGAARGGGLHVSANGSNRSISNTQMDDNQAFSTTGQSQGGSIYNLGGFWTLAGSTVSGSSADQGGGIFADYNLLTINNSTISGNTAQNGGGIFQGNRSGYYNSTSPLRVRNSTITANTATATTATGGVGGGIVDTQSVGASQFQSTVVSGNLAPNANPARADLVMFRGEISGANNLVVNATGVTLPAGTLSADPVLGPLQDNGGPTWTHALLPGSPAIDVGNNSQNFATDQRGSGFPRVVGTATDIGAFEYRTFAAPTLAAAFAPDDIVGGDTTTLTITLSNANDVAARLTADLLDTLPVPVVLADPVDALNGCGGSLTATPGAGSFTLGAGAEIPAEGFCTVSVTVTVNASGVFTHTLEAGALQTILGANTDPASATLTVTAPNLPPLAADDTYEVVVDDILKVAAPGVLGNDSDPNVDPLSAVLVSGPAHGTLWFDPSGGFVYRPEAGFLGTDTFTYAASDGQATTPATVTIMVTPPPHDALFADGFESP